MEEVLKEILDKVGKIETILEKVTEIDTRLKKVEITLENETNRKIDIIGEGHDFLKRRLDGALSLEKDKERMELELMNLKMDIRKIKDKLDIA